MNHSGFGILIPFSRSVALSSIACLLLATTFDSCHSISITLHCAFAITCTFVSCCTSTCTFMDNCCSTATMFSSLASFYTSTKCYSIASSSSDSSMNIESIDVLVLSILLHTNVVCLCAKTQLHMFQLYLCLDLSSMQTIYFPYTPSLLHIPKMMMNAMATL